MQITSATRAGELNNDKVLSDYKDLIKRITEMRRLQRSYFKNKEKQTLIWSKNKEAEIDRIIQEFQQPKLF